MANCCRSAIGNRPESACRRSSNSRNNGGRCRLPPLQFTLQPAQIVEQRRGRQPEQIKAECRILMEQVLTLTLSRRKSRPPDRRWRREVKDSKAWRDRLVHRQQLSIGTMCGCEKTRCGQADSISRPQNGGLPIRPWNRPC